MESSGEVRGNFNLSTSEDQFSDPFISSTLEGFLHGYDNDNDKNSSLTNLLPIQNPINTTPMIRDCYCGLLSPWSLGVGFDVNSDDSSLLTMQEIEFVDSLLVDGVYEKKTDDVNKKRRRNYNASKNNEKGKRAKSSTSTKKKSQVKEKALGKGPWSQEEDSLLRHLVEMEGGNDWNRIADRIEGRSGKRCRERWNCHLRPDIKKEPWTKYEENMLVEAHKLHGNKWSIIAEQIPGRSDNCIKNLWNAAKKRVENRLTQKSKRILAKPPTPLENYIALTINNIDDP